MGQSALIVRSLRFSFFAYSCLFASFAYIISLSTSRADNYILHSYHNVPPFVTGPETGLTYDLAQQLTMLSKGKHSFQVKLVPRKRLNEIMSRENVIVPWVTPVWFKSQKTPNTSWSAPIMLDTSVYIWSGESTKSYKTPSDLIGTKLGGIRGYKYIGVDDLVKEGKLQRTDTSSEWQLLQMVLSRRVDVGIIPEAGACNLIRKHGLFGQLQISQHHSFTRKLMITGETDRHLLEDVNQLENNSVWRTKLASYGARVTPLGKRNANNYCDRTLTTSLLISP